MAVVSFLNRRQQPPIWRVVLRKGDRQRVYDIRPAGQPGTFQASVRFNTTPHRSKLVASPVALHAIRQQFTREIAELQADGWTPDA